MKLTRGNIMFVKENTLNGITYSWHVAMRSNSISDSRHYCHTDKEGRTIVEQYRRECLPATIQKYINNSHREVFYEREEPSGYTGGHYVQYIYR